MNLVIIDGQGGGLGRQLVSAVKDRYPDIEIIAVGANSAATNAMLRAGATPAMAQAVGQSRAKRILIPVNLCDNIIVGVTDLSMTKNVQNAVEILGTLID